MDENELNREKAELEKLLGDDYRVGYQSVIVAPHENYAEYYFFKVYKRRKEEK